MPRNSETTGTLRRGSACLSCRRRKLRCDGARPICHQCNTMRRGHECSYDDSARKSRTQALREKLSALEAKVRELESGPGATPSLSATTSYGSSTTDDGQPVASTSRSGSSEFWLQDSPEATFPDLDFSQSQSWFASYEYDSTNDMGSTSQLMMPMSLMMPPYDNQPTITHQAYTDSSGTPVRDGPGDRSINEPIVTLTIEMHNLLIQSFIEHRKQCCFYSNTSRFDRSSSATIYQNTPPNSALMSAIYLMGCFFARIPGLESQLLEQTQHEVSRALHNQEQLMDLVQALCLLAQYFFFNHRAMEGKLHLQRAKLISIDFGLHQITHSDFPFDLQFPFDSATYNWQEKSAIFWQVVMVEKFWSSSNDCCEAIPDFEASNRYITTPLPVLEGAELVLIANSPLYDIFEGEHFCASMLSVTAFKVIVSSVFDRSLRVNNTSMMSKDATTWLYHRATAMALERLTTIVHPFAFGDPLQRSSAVTPRFDTDLYAVHSLILASTIHLHLDNVMDLKVSWAAKKIVELINYLGSGDYQYLDPILSVSALSPFHRVGMEHRIYPYAIYRFAGPR
ncbi:hypothetical protein CPC08DRAFT_807219 [Agrocybe pediades]|nr:hypothetical protein CPC08DRAFT_807219 [Agrocybe pediades]